MNDLKLAAGAVLIAVLAACSVDPQAAADRRAPV